MKKRFAPILLIALFFYTSLVLTEETPYNPFLDSVSPSFDSLRTLFPEVNLQSGAFVYPYNIEIPEGTEGFSPKLTLIYSSLNSREFGFLGSNWEITDSYIILDTNYTLLDESDDSFILVLNGRSYRLAYDSLEDRFHTKRESYFHITNESGGNNTNGKYWILKTPEGTQFRFGYQNESELISNLGDFTVRWSLDLLNSTYGNSIFYSYLEDPFLEDIGTVYPHKITYNNLNDREIRFFYEAEDRPEIRQAFYGGNEEKYSRKLKEIATFAEGSLVKRYVIEYKNLENIKTKSFISNITSYGSDNLTFLPPVVFSYEENSSGWINVTDSLKLPSCLESSAHTLADVNKDGLVDFIDGLDGGDDGDCKYDGWENNKRYVHINNGSGWTNDTNIDTAWKLPDCLEKEFHILVDVNNDGLVDFVDGIDGGNNGICTGPDDGRRVYINNGTTWENTTLWKLPDCLESGYHRMLDVNGDGLVDYIDGQDEGSGCSQPSNLHTYINNGSGWEEDSFWRIPKCLEFSGHRFADINGDNLIDFIDGHDEGGEGCPTTSHRYVYINNGSGWEEDPTWNINDVCLEFTGHRLADINGDGMADYIDGNDEGANGCDPGEDLTVWFSNGTGWTNDESWNLSKVCLEQNGQRLADINGDGLVDVVDGQDGGDDGSCIGPDGGRQIFLNNNDKIYLLKNITNSKGGITSIDYIKSTFLDNTGEDNLSDLGFNLWVVSNITKDNGMNNGHKVFSKISYNYSGGEYDYIGKEFRGFNYVEEKIDNKIVKHYFHQSEDLKGKEYKTEIQDNANNTYQKIEKIWSPINKSGYFVVNLNETSEFTYDNQTSNPKIKNVTYEYDENGNTIRIYYKGDINNPNDDRFENYSYLNNSELWIINKIKNYTLFSADSTKIAQNLYSYDNLTYATNPKKGSITSKEEVLFTGDNVVTNYTYSSQGNLITQTNPRGFITTYTYGIRDDTFTFIDQIINPLNQITNYEYDIGTGNLLWIRDSNEIETNYTYDTFGRKTSETKAYDNHIFPTINYSYNFNGTAPNKIKTSSREQNITQNTYDEYSFYDGFNRLIQTKKESANDTRQIVSDTYYDEFGRISNQSNPYYSEFTKEYTPLNSTVNKTNFFYDVIDRIVLVVNPDGSNKTTEYLHWNTTFFDENGNFRQQEVDAYGQIIQVREFIDGNIYITHYRYDTMGNLILINDSLGNEWIYTFDSLGRKTAGFDPDTGWANFTYDANSNIIEEISGGGNLVNDSTYVRHYNDFGQLTKIYLADNSTLVEEYTYDPNGDRIKTFNNLTNTTTYTPFKEFMMVINSSGVCFILTSYLNKKNIMLI